MAHPGGHTFSKGVELPQNAATHTAQSLNCHLWELQIRKMNLLKEKKNDVDGLVRG